MENRFDYVKYDEIAIALQLEAKMRFKAIEEYLNRNFPDGGRSLSLVFTKIEETYMWLGKTIRDEQIKRNGSADIQN